MDAPLCGARAVCAPARMQVSGGFAEKDNPLKHASGLRLFFLAQQTNDAAECLNARAAAKRGIHLVPERFCSLLTELLGREWLDQLSCRLGGTAIDNPLQRYKKNPFHGVTPALPVADMLSTSGLSVQGFEEKPGTGTLLLIESDQEARMAGKSTHSDASWNKRIHSGDLSQARIP